MGRQCLALEVRECDSEAPAQLAVEVGGIESVRWATLDPMSTVPAAQWGLTDVCVVHRSTSPLAPRPGKLIPLEAIRPPLPTPEAGGDYHIIEIIGQLRVAADQFGRHFWHLVQTKVPGLSKRLDKAPLTTIEYSDRYLCTPLTVRLLLETLRTLKQQHPNAFTSSTRIIVNAAPLESHGRHGSPVAFTHDWRDGPDRRATFAAAAAQLELTVELRELSKNRLPHHRGFTFTWAPKDTWTMGLDQGFGFLEDVQRQTESFPFQADARRQATKLMDAKLHVDRQFPFPSRFFVQHVPQ